ncbi:fibropellin-3 isoform X2 [Magallana gigas]|uniref:fibropellin-3 isoform X2 n=1 Tax=Magallana gigas TaxID=29159 RepID=UPI00333E264B
MMVVTWEDVAAFGCSSSGTLLCSQRNTFQLVLITDGVHSFAVFNYNKITWTMSTQVGFNAGDGTHYYAVPGSMTDSMLNLPQLSNIGVPGQFVFRVDESNIANADVIDECISSPCMHGNCSNEYLHYVCICQPGYTGINCEIEIDECQSSPCIHGSCIDQLNHYTCHCEPGYTGYNCQTDIDECSSSPCVYGTCLDLVNGYVCNCLPGYTGRLCEIDIDECQSSPCINGNCTNNINFYTCQCFAGFTGTNCEIDIDECASSPYVHGNCTDQVNGYVCECIPGYTGVICETEINECESSPCSHGVCHDEINAYQCVCDTGYYGRQCSYFDVLYLWPLLVGLLLLLLSILLLFLWKRWERHYSGEEESGLLAFSDITLGPGKADFQSSPHVNKTKILIPVKEGVGFFLKINRSLTSSNFVKLVEKVKMSANRVLDKIDIVKG